MLNELQEIIAEKLGLSAERGTAGEESEGRSEG